MINFFKKSTEKNTVKKSQTESAVNKSDNAVDNSKKEAKPVHGENGVCCGGCGGQ
ncbi:MAG: CCGSCS motif protein [Colwellia sp.]